MHPYVEYALHTVNSNNSSCSQSDSVQSNSAPAFRVIHGSYCELHFFIFLAQDENMSPSQYTRFVRNVFARWSSFLFACYLDGESAFDHTL